MSAYGTKRTSLMTGDEARRIAANPIAKLPKLLRKA
jgi:hypothetical protein